LRWQQQRGHARRQLATLVRRGVLVRVREPACGRCGREGGDHDQLGEVPQQRPSQTEAKTLLQQGDSLGPALKKAAQEDKATGGTRSAKVTKITFTSPTQANVNYLLKAAGRTLNAAGIAVLEDGTWKVSDITFCTLVVLGNGSRPVKGCAS